MSYPTYPYRGTQEKCRQVGLTFPPQHQAHQPGLEYLMDPLPIAENPTVKGRGKLQGKTALITGGDSGIGRAVAYAFAKEGANVAVSYLDEERDAKETQKHIEELGTQCILLPADLRERRNAKRIVRETVDLFGGIDVLVNNHGVQFVRESILDITQDQLADTFATNVYGFFYVIQEALPFIPEGGAIINTTSITAYQGDDKLIDYSATKGAIVSLTRSLAKSLISRKIRVNAVAPGPVWTPLQPASFPADALETFGSFTSETLMGRAGQPLEMAQGYVYLACDDSSLMTGQVLHIDGGSLGYS